MQSTSSASHRKVVGAAPARAADHATPTPASALPDLRAARRVLAGTRFNRDLLALIRHTERLRDRLHRFLDHDYGSVAKELVNAGLIDITQIVDPDVEELLHATETAPDDIRGFLWALDQFLANAASLTIPLYTLRGVDDAAPTAVVADTDRGSST